MTKITSEECAAYSPVVPRSWNSRIRCPEINSGQNMSSDPLPSRFAGFSPSDCPPYVFADNEALPNQIDSGVKWTTAGHESSCLWLSLWSAMTSRKNLGTKTAQDLRASSTPPGTSGGESGIVFAEANTGNPLRGDFERMARRRFQDPKPRRRGDWWTIQVRQDVFIDGELKRSNRRVRLAPATMLEREVRKVAAEYLRPLNQEMQNIGSATNFAHYVEHTYLAVVMPLFAKSTRDRSTGILENYLLPTFGGLSLRDLTRCQSRDIFPTWQHPS